MVQGRLFRASAATLAMVAIMLSAVSAPASADGGEGKTRDQGQVEAETLLEDQAPAIPEKQAQRYPNLGSHLDRLAVQVEAGQAFVGDAAEGQRFAPERKVAVTIHISGNVDVDKVASFLEDNGGDPRNVGEDYIEAYVPVALLGELSQQAGVQHVREIVAPQTDQSPTRVAGHGPPVHGSVAWNQAGYAGQGGKVGIIDIGFRGFSSLMGGELPATVAARCYTEVGVYTSNLADCEAADDATVGVPFPECKEAVQRREFLATDHGTIVAEAIMDIAPEVSLYIARPRSKADVQDAVAWMASEGVTVINQSLSWTLDGPGDGTSPRSNSPLRTVDMAVARDITWVNSAGNGARTTWFGGYEDPDGDGAISFGGLNDEVLDIPLRECRRYTIQLRWEDTWDGASTNLDLYLYHKRSGQLILSISSEDEQSGQSGHDPFEWLSFWSRTDSNDLGLIVYHHGGDAPEWIQLTVWGAGSIERYTKSGSIANPSESANPGLLAVGAAHWDDVHAIEPYSSRGPTPDGRIKPDVVGADCGATALAPLDEYSQGFCGTSQAAPHVAGLAALVRQRFPGYTPAQVAGYLKDHAEQREAPDPNNTWGHGFVKLPPPDGSTPRDPASPRTFTRSLADDFDTLEAFGNTAPTGIWSDGTTMWVADRLDAKIYAYAVATNERVPASDFNTLGAAGNTEPRGIWSDGTTMWVADSLDEKIYAYDMATKARVPGREFNTLAAADNTGPQGIWSDGTTMWVADWFDAEVYAYDMATRERVPGRDFDALKAARNALPRGMWSDGTTMWVADAYSQKIYAYDVATKARVPGMEFNTLQAAGNWAPQGIWSNGTTMWVADLSDGKLYAYDMQRESEADREALVAFYNATGGAGWTSSANWLTDAHIGQWHGVTTDDDGRVTHLALSENQLTGGIPTELGSLVNLEELWLSENQLTGEIPTELGSLANLEKLILWGNQLAGPVPTWLGSLSNLTALSLGGNELTGEIPTELGSLSNLTLLSLSENQLTGGIPTELGSLANLDELDLLGNQLSGSIPTELGDLSNLTLLSLSENQLTGGIPTELGSLANLKELWLWENQLSGSIPTELGDLSNLTVLNLSGNELTGEIPAELGGLANLAQLNLLDNRLTGEIPSELGHLDNLEELYLRGNLLTRCIPTALQVVPTNDLGQLGLPFCIPPEFSAAETGERSVAENTGPGMPIGGPVEATDADSVTLTYTLGGTDAVAFAIDPRTGQLMTKAALDHETKDSYEVVVTATDPSGESADKSVTITVTDVDEAPVLAGSTVVSYPEGGTDPVATYTATDPEGEAITWSLSGDDAADFTITGGVLAFAASPDYGIPADADTNNEYLVTVEVSDGTNTASIHVTVTVTAETPQTLLERYDADNSGTIEKSEVINAINDYLFGTGADALSKEQMIEVINLYLFG